MSLPPKIPSTEGTREERYYGAAFIAITSYPGDRNRCGHVERQTGLKRRVISLSVEQDSGLTCCFSCPATVGAASAVPHHQLSALHHRLKRLSANEWTVHMKQSSKLKCGAASFYFGPIILFFVSFSDSKCLMPSKVRQVGQ